MKAKLDLKRFTVNENGSELHFIALNVLRAEKVINLINALSHPQAIKMCLKFFKHKKNKDLMKF
jgi:hypothetical protein